MPIQPPLLNRKRMMPMLTLATFLASVYMLTYSGRIESSDTRALFDTVSSLVQHGDMYLDVSAWYNYPQPSAQGDYPLVRVDTEPMQPILAAPLFWLAQELPGVGLNHAVWLFNVLIGALAGVVLFLYALALGYRETTAVIAALLFGCCTIIWPYSKSFFREPLATLLILVAALFIERWRGNRYRSMLLFVGAALALLGAWLSKEAVIFAAPALFIIAVPSVQFAGTRRLVTAFLLLVVTSLVALLAVSILLSPEGLTTLQAQIANVTGRSLFNIQNLHHALHAYLFSIGGSFWATSPIVLLALPGLWLMYRRGHYRYVIALVVVVMTFVGGYALLRGVHWFGGLSWPPRFMIPIIPFLILGALPAIELLMNRIVSRWVALLAAALVIFSLWVQLSGLLLPWETYTQVIPAEAGGLGEWGGGLNQIQYLRWVVLPPLWSQRPLDLAWVRLNIPLWPLAFLVLGIYSLLRIRALLSGNPAAKSRSSRLARLSGVAAPLLFVVITYLGLRAIYRDPAYLGDRDALHAIMPTIASIGQPGGVMLLDQASQYDLFFMNYAKFRYPRVITLSNQPGEQPSPEKPPKIQSDNTDALLLKITPPLIQNLAATRTTLWLMEDAGPWLPWRVRPIERYVAAHYYPIQELSTNPPDPTIRLIEFSTTPAPDPFGFRGAERLTDLRFGRSIRLVGFTLPLGATYQPGTILPISFYWGADERPDRDYTVAWFLVSDDSSRVVQGADYQPGWGFAPTSRWRPGVPVWDNHALRLPAELPDGHYQLWLRLYQSDAPDQLLPVNGGLTFDAETGILPIRIDIAP